MPDSHADSVPEMVLPTTFRKLICNKLTKDFRDAISIQTVPLPKLGANDVLVRNRFVGINASDINIIAGLYGLLTHNPPFGVGLEGVGNVVEVGSEVTNVKRGQDVCFMTFEAYSEYIVVPSQSAFPVPSAQPEYIGLLISGLTADIALREAGRVREGETVLVTAAAGGTGQFAVQYAKHAGCHVIGTCSSESKVKLLKSLGCDRPINYKSENLKEVLKKEYPNGVDVVYECVGGDIFHTCLNSLAPKGRLVTIGFIAGYKDTAIPAPTLNSDQVMRIATTSASIKGFLLFHYANEWRNSFNRQAALLEQGSLKVAVDMGKDSNNGSFKGVEAIADAVEYLYTGQSLGKVVVEVNDALAPASGL